MKPGTGPRILDLLKTSGPVSAGFVAKRIGISEVGARKYLIRLQKRGLVVAQDLAVSVGRPKRAWSVAEGADSQFPNGHADLALELLRGARESGGGFGLDRIIAAREADTLARYKAVMTGKTTLRAGLEKLVELRSADGYMAELKEAPDGAPLLIENHCPIRKAAAHCPGLCRSELELFRQVLGPGVSIERVEHIQMGARRCAYRIAPALLPAQA